MEESVFARRIEGRGIFPNLSVRENLVMAERLLHGGLQLSGGEQQMLAIGRALNVIQDFCVGRVGVDVRASVRDDRQGASACVVVRGQHCQQTPCPEGRKCMAVFGSSKAGQVWMECYPQCGKELSPCPEGFLCEGRMCRKACEPSGLDVCEPGFRCLRRFEQQPWMCQPDM